MSRSTISTLSALMLVFALSAAGAEECVPVTANPEFDSDRDAPGAWDAIVGPPHRQFYLDNDACQLDGCGLSFWVYEESNGIPGLQRKDDFIGDQTCGLWPADTIVF